MPHQHRLKECFSWALSWASALPLVKTWVLYLMFLLIFNVHQFFCDVSKWRNFFLTLFSTQSVFSICRVFSFNSRKYSVTSILNLASLLFHPFLQELVSWYVLILLNRYSVLLSSFIVVMILSMYTVFKVNIHCHCPFPNLLFLSCQEFIPSIDIFPISRTFFIVRISNYILFFSILISYLYL